MEVLKRRLLGMALLSATLTAQADFGHTGQPGRVRLRAFQALGRCRYEAIP